MSATTDQEIINIETQVKQINELEIFTDGSLITESETTDEGDFLSFEK